MTADGRRYEPIRDDEDDTILVTCPNCVNGTVTVERGGRSKKSACRECSGSGKVLPEPIEFDLSHLLLPEDDGG